MCLVCPLTRVLARQLQLRPVKEEVMKVKTNVRAGSVSTVTTQILQQAQSVRTAALQNLR